MRGFSRSSRFGVIGVFVVMAVCAAIGLTLGSGEAKPKLALGLIFGVIALYLVILFTLQSRDAAAGGADGIVVARKRDNGGDFLCDLWLAELLAGGAGRGRKE